MTEVLEQIGEDIWTCNGDIVKFTCLRIPFTTRMVIVRLANEKLWILSPVTPTVAIVDALETLGKVAFVVAPNKIHCLNTATWKERFPNAEVWLSPGAPTRHKTLTYSGILGVDPSPKEWEGKLAHTLIEGSSMLDEVFFFHISSKTLLITDYIQRHYPSRAKEEGKLWTKIKKAVGIFGEEGAAPKDLRATFKGKNGTRMKAGRESIERVMKWDFESIVIAHGLNVERDAKEYMKKAFSWMYADIKK